MKKNLKLLISSLIIALTFASPQAIHGTEDFSKPCEQDAKRPYALRVSSGCDITEVSQMASSHPQGGRLGNIWGLFVSRIFPLWTQLDTSGSDSTEESQQEKRRSEEIRENPFEWCPIEIKFSILERAVIDNYLSYGHTGNLGGVCRDWRDIIELDAMKKSIESIKHEQIYQRFLKGVLIYRPQEGSDVGRIDLPIAALENPLEGTFDLSQCGDVGEYLSISTGYRKGKKTENANKVEIWFAPRFLIEKELTTTASHFQDIYGKWSDKAPVGIFWTWGGWDNLNYYDYHVTENLEALSNNNLFEKWLNKTHIHGPAHAFGPLRQGHPHSVANGQYFMFIL